MDRFAALVLTSMTRLCPGFLLGSLGLGWLSDRIGRKRNLMVTLAGLLATNLVSAATPHYSVYLVSRCGKEAEALEFVVMVLLQVPDRNLPGWKHPLRRHAAQRVGGALLPRPLLSRPHGLLLSR